MSLEALVLQGKHALLQLATPDAVLRVVHSKIRDEAAASSLMNLARGELLSSEEKKTRTEWFEV